MATFEERVEGLIGYVISSSSTVPTQGELTEFLKDGVNEVTNLHLGLKPQDAYMFVRESAQSQNNDIVIDSAKIVSVVREAGVSNEWREARLIKHGGQSRAKDKTSLDYASKYHPVYTIADDGLVSVFPSPGSDPNQYKVYYVNGTPTDKTNSASLTYAHSDIKYFPEDKVYLVVLYAAIKSLERKLAEYAIDEEDAELVTALQPSLLSYKNQWQSAFGAMIPKEERGR